MLILEYISTHGTPEWCAPVPFLKVFADSQSDKVMSPKILTKCIFTS